ncbi:MAG: glycoside hydrolase family 88 protein [Bryobacteraceae bacterium]|nr:glycoside hydrolase family 88 protein [Bryobacteraceae bacterium]
MIRLDSSITPTALLPRIADVWSASAPKIYSIDRSCDPAQGAPVFTVAGRYTARGWTEWTQGFQFGSAILQFDATGERDFLEMGRARTLGLMAPHLTHIGVHDHGFNNVSTYGNLYRLAKEGLVEAPEWELHFHELALKVTGAIQAARWTAIPGGGYIHSFNGPHSLFVDTIRSLRALAVSHRLGHSLMGENDRKHSLLERLVQHAQATAMYSVYYGEGRDAYDLRGRTAHESVFNTTDGNFRCPNSQQGYSPFSTWTRGLAWAMCGFAEQLEFLQTIAESELESLGGRAAIEGFMRKAAEATCDFYIEHTPTDGVPYWDTGAPNLYKLGDYLDRPADPFNEHEPVDASAAAIAAQGLLRLGRYLGEAGARYLQAGLTVMQTICAEPYLSKDPDHQGLLLHSVYHRPNGWDFVPEGRNVPCGESSMWGDYHLREAALYVQRLANGDPYLTFWA